jgi:hypothetical protein
MKHLSKAMACDAFGEERQKSQKRRRTTSGPKPKLFLWGTWCAQGDDLRTFLAEFVSIRPQAEVPTQIEALIY